MAVIDTPGIGSSSDVAAHIAAQLVAVEEIPISGVYVVVKYAHRSDDLAQAVEPIMDFLGTDDIRIIITHMDTVGQGEVGFDPNDLKNSLANNLDIPLQHIKMVGKATSGKEIEEFIHSSLHEPAEFEITDETIASIASLAGVRKYNKPINRILTKIEAAASGCRDLVERGKSYESDIAIIATQTAVAEMVAREKEIIFDEALENCVSIDMQNLVYGKAGMNLSMKLQAFIKTTNQLLTWDVTDPEDARNHYRQCPNCDAVYVKIGGCDTMYCGDWKHVPERDTTKTSSSKIDVKFVEKAQSYSSFRLQYFYDGVQYAANAFAGHLRSIMGETNKTRATDEEMKTKMDEAQGKGTRELNIYCHRPSKWSEMLPLRAETLKELGCVPLMREGGTEKIIHQHFDQSLKKHKAKNKSKLNLVCSKKLKALNAREATQGGSAPNL